MCGITGKVYSKRGEAVEQNVLEAMCGTLIHRGPDDDGYYLKGNVGLAMRRLSVIDLAGGKQPVHNEAENVWVVYNGEIYNFPTLREALEKQGHRFYTHSDTEVIVHLYEEYGTDFPRHLEGMFAIALWDEREERLILARDRMGIKPLYYAPLPDRLLFGSEIKAIRADNPNLTLDPEGLSVYLSLLYIPAPHSIYREIRKLEPGNLLVWKDGRVRMESYWDLAKIQPLTSKVSLPELRQELRSILISSVKSQLIADVPVGFFLSGGIDSSAVVACARQAHSGQLRTFSVGFDDPSYDETSYAEMVARHVGTDHTKLRVEEHIKDLAPKLASYFDEPFADSSAIPTYYLSELTREHVTVALSGDGGDELFAGYLTYQADKLARLYDRLPGPISRGLVPGLVRRLPVSDKKVSFGFKAGRFVESALLEPGRRHYAWKAFFSDALKASLVSPDILAAGGDLDGYYHYRRHYEAVPHMDSISRFQYADTKVYLVDNNLTKVDRMSMAHSLEVRVPLLDTRLVEFAFRLPGNVRMPGLKLKHFLRESVRDLLPPEIMKRPKKGFNAPMPRWLKEDLRPLLDDVLSPETVRKQGYFRPEVVNGLMKDHLEGRADYSRNLWALLNFGLWVEQAKMYR